MCVSLQVISQLMQLFRELIYKCKSDIFISFCLALRALLSLPLSHICCRSPILPLCLSLTHSLPLTL